MSLVSNLNGELFSGPASLSPKVNGLPDDVSLVPNLNGELFSGSVSLVPNLNGELFTDPASLFPKVNGLPDDVFPRIVPETVFGALLVVV